VNEAVRSYIDAIDLAHRPLFDQVHELIMAALDQGGPDRAAAGIEFNT
jgi:hypothetical protein